MQGCYKAMNAKLVAVLLAVLLLSAQAAAASTAFDSVFNAILEVFGALFPGAAAPPGQPNPPAVPIRAEPDEPPGGGGGPAAPAALADPDAALTFEQLQLKYPWPEVLQFGVTEANKEPTYTVAIVYRAKPVGEVEEPLKVEPPALTGVKLLEPTKAVTVSFANDDQHKGKFDLTVKPNYAEIVKVAKNGLLPVVLPFTLKLSFASGAGDKIIPLLIKLNEPGLVVVRKPYYVDKTGTSKEPCPPGEAADAKCNYFNQRRIAYIQSYVADAEGWGPLLQVPFNMAKEDEQFFTEQLNGEKEIDALIEESTSEKFKTFPLVDREGKDYSGLPSRFDRDLISQGKFLINWFGRFYWDDKYGYDVWDVGEIYYPDRGFKIYTEFVIDAERHPTKVALHYYTRKEDAAADSGGAPYQKELAKKIRDEVVKKVGDHVPAYLYLVGAAEEIPLIDRGGLLKLGPHYDYLRQANEESWKNIRPSLDAAFYGNLVQKEKDPNDWVIDVGGVSRLPLQSINSFRHYQTRLFKLNKDKRNGNLLNRALIVLEPYFAPVVRNAMDPYRLAQALIHTGQKPKVVEPQDYVQGTLPGKEFVSIDHQYPFSFLTDLLLHPKRQGADFIRIVSPGLGTGIARIKDDKIKEVQEQADGAAIYDQTQADFFGVAAIVDYIKEGKVLSDFTQKPWGLDELAGRLLMVFGNYAGEVFGMDVLRLGYTNFVGAVSTPILYARGYSPNDQREFDPAFSQSGGTTISKSFVDFINAKSLVADYENHASAEDMEEFVKKKKAEVKDDRDAQEKLDEWLEAVSAYDKSDIYDNQFVLYGNPTVSYVAAQLPKERKLSLVVKDVSEDRKSVLLEMPPLPLEGLFQKNRALSLTADEIASIGNGKYAMVKVEDTPLTYLEELGGVLCHRSWRDSDNPNYRWQEIQDNYIVIESSKSAQKDARIEQLYTKEIKSWLDDKVYDGVAAAKALVNGAKVGVDKKNLLVVPARCVSAFQIGIVIVNGKVFYDNGVSLLPVDVKEPAKLAALFEMNAVVEINLVSKDGKKVLENLYKRKGKEGAAGNYLYFYPKPNNWDRAYGDLFFYNGKNAGNGFVLPPALHWLSTKAKPLQVLYSNEIGLTMHFIHTLLKKANAAKDPYTIEVVLEAKKP